MSSTQPRILFGSIDGTWAGSVNISRKTVVSELPSLMMPHGGIMVRIAANGVGSGSGLAGRVLSALSGLGTRRNVIETFRRLADNYAPGDKIILCGYSRGAWAVRYLAQLIHSVGLPKNGDHRLYHCLYKGDDSILDPTVADKIIKDLGGDYKFWSVEIEALCCFDTVGSLGLPLFGLAKPFSLLLPRKEPDVVSTIAPNVKRAFHCLSLHETREPFSPTRMAGSNILEVFFLGTHGDMGWVEEGETLVLAPLAFMIQQLSNLGIQFDEAKLAARFPAYRPQSSTLPSLAPVDSALTDTNSASVANSNHNGGMRWWQRRIFRPTHLLLAFIGKKPRRPGCLTQGSRTPAPSCVSRDDGDADADPDDRDASRPAIDRQGSSTPSTWEAQVHVGARLRASEGALDSVPGYVLAAPPNVPPHWVLKKATGLDFARGTTSTELQAPTCQGDDQSQPYRPAPISTPWSWGRTRSPEVLPDTLTEAPYGPLETMLLGIPI